MTRNVFKCALHAVGDFLPMPHHPRDDGTSKPKWTSKWEFERNGKRVKIVVVANGPGGETETIDAREFIERLGDDRQDATYTIHVGTEEL